MAGHACNGWAFWSLAGAERPAHKAKAAPSDKPRTAAKAAPKTKGKNPAKNAGDKKNAKRKAARAAATGGSYSCGACPETFPTMKVATAHALTRRALTDLGPPCPTQAPRGAFRRCTCFALSPPSH